MTRAAEVSRRSGAFRRVWQRLRGGELSPTRAGLSLFVGLFVGCQPFYGLHLVLCLVVCLPLRLDFVLAYLAANVSNPLVAPFLLWAELQTGAWLIDGAFLALDVESVRGLGVTGLVLHTLVGAMVVGAVLATLGGAGGYAAVRAIKRRSRVRGPESALGRTLERYAGAHVSERAYVSLKLAMDPLTRQLEQLELPCGLVLDVGCGRGQFSLLLLELGKAERVMGFDWDAAKVHVAEQAADGAAEYRVADTATFELPAADTVLLFDVLHYLPLAEQRQLLERVRASLVQGGLLLVRELDQSSGLASSLGRWLERVATATGYNRVRQLTFRPACELVAELSGLGFSCVVERGRRLPWSAANVLIIARLAGGAGASSAAVSSSGQRVRPS